MSREASSLGTAARHVGHPETSSDTAWPRHPGGIDQLRVLASQIRAVARDPSEGVHDPAALRDVAVPTLIIHGDRDDLYPLSLAVELFGMLPNAELWGRRTP